jgi:5,10-methylenetetrahydromethanopterin reductase
LSISKIGLRFSSRIPVSDVARLSSVAEAAGFRSIWVAENPYARSGTSTLIEIARVTREAKLGIGVASPALRHPVILAMEAATIDEVSNGRFILGLGRRDLETGGSKGSLALMRDSIQSIRRLILGEEISTAGEVFKFGEVGRVYTGRAAKLQFKPIRSRIPILIGATGPRMQELAAEVAEGILLGSLASPGFVEHSERIIQAALGKFRRSRSDFLHTSYLFSFISDDEEKARADARNFILTYIGFIDHIVMSTAGIPDSDFYAVKDALTSGRRDEALRNVTDRMVDQLTLTGNLEFCRKRIQEYLAAGLDEVILGFQSTAQIGADAEGSIRKLAAALS